MNNTLQLYYLCREWVRRRRLYTDDPSPDNYLPVTDIERRIEAFVDKIEKKLRDTSHLVDPLNNNY